MKHILEDMVKSFIISRMMGGEGDISRGESLFETGIVDSLRLMELVAFVEKTFQIKINMGEVTVHNFESINNICALIRNKQKR